MPGPREVLQHDVHGVRTTRSTATRVHGGSWPELLLTTAVDFGGSRMALHGGTRSQVSRRRSPGSRNITADLFAMDDLANVGSTGTCVAVTTKLRALYLQAFREAVSIWQTSWASHPDWTVALMKGNLWAIYAQPRGLTTAKAETAARARSLRLLVHEYERLTRRRHWRDIPRRC